MSPFRTLAALGAAALLASAAAAQAPAPAAPAAAPAVAANPASMPQCEKPDSRPNRLASNDQLNRWHNKVKKWEECMKKGVAELQAKADVAIKAASGAIADANAAIAAYNETVKDLQAQEDAAK
jgi:hypothetical protein